MPQSREAEAAATSLVNALLVGRAWATETITYAVSAEPPKDGAYVEPAVSDPSEALRQAVARAMAEVEAITQLDLVETAPEDATIRVFQAESVSIETPNAVQTIALGGYAFFPGETAEAGDIWIGNDVARNLSPGSYGYRTLLHELGHALGLKEPHRAGPLGHLTADVDGPQISVMSARTAPGAPAGHLDVVPSGHAETFMTGDIAALQHLYGANFGPPQNDHHVFDPGERFIHRTIWDGGGRDTFDFSAYATALAVDLRPGGVSTTGQEPLLNHAAVLGGETPIWAEGAIHIAELPQDDRRALVEDAFGGSGDDRIVGNIAGNRLEGRGGDDRVVGLGGHDNLRGGPGEDTLTGNRGDDLGKGGSGADRLSGGDGDDHLVGGSDSDTLDGDGGDDALIGGHGRDVLRGGLGSDILRGWGGSDILAGNGGHDSLAGNAGNDRLVGGEGDDTLAGGPGADIFVFGSDGGRDIVTDFNSATDRIKVMDPDGISAPVALDDGTLVSVAADTTVFFQTLAPADLADALLH